MSNLISSMNQIVDKDVKDNKEDVTVDLKVLLTSSARKFIWIIRPTGTNIVNEEFIKFSDTEENATFNYLMSYSDIVNCYRISVQEIISPEKIIGTISKINGFKLYSLNKSCLRKMNYKELLNYTSHRMHSKYSFHKSEFETFYSNSGSLLVTQTNEYIDFLIEMVMYCGIHDSFIFSKMKKCKTIDNALEVFDTFCNCQSNFII